MEATNAQYDVICGALCKGRGKQEARAHLECASADVVAERKAACEKLIGHYAHTPDVTLAAIALHYDLHATPFAASGPWILRMWVARHYYSKR
jgi:hypothetical protein